MKRIILLPAQKGSHGNALTLHDLADAHIELVKGRRLLFWRRRRWCWRLSSHTHHPNRTRELRHERLSGRYSQRRYTSRPAGSQRRHEHAGPCAE